MPASQNLIAGTVPIRPYNQDGLCGEEHMGEGLGFVWNATRGHRLRPWRSPYLRWRLETFTGKHAEQVRAVDFWGFLWSERRQLLRFLGWLGEMREYAQSSDRD